MTFRYHDYVEIFQDGVIMSRRQVAESFGVGASTARYHLERAVAAGLLNKQYGWTGKQSGWLYGLPTTLQYLPFMPE